MGPTLTRVCPSWVSQPVTNSTPKQHLVSKLAVGFSFSLEAPKLMDDLGPTVEKLGPPRHPFLSGIRLARVVFATAISVLRQLGNDFIPPVRQDAQDTTVTKDLVAMSPVAHEVSTSLV